jgi:anti-sigma B factor antagonist
MQGEQLIVNISSGPREGERIFKLNGPLTMTSLYDFQSAVRAEKAPTVILDLSQVPYIDSTGLGSVVNAHISCINSGRHLAIVGISERVRTLFKLARLERVLAIFPTIEDAEKNLTTH